MRQTEHVLYITLIDFLLQLLFLGMVVSVIYAVSQREEHPILDPAQAKDAIDSMEKIKNLTGISDITKLTDQLTRLGRLQTASNHAELGRDMEKAVLGAGGKEIARKILAEHAAKRGGQGKPSCLPEGAKLATFHAYPDRIELASPASKEMADLLRRMDVSIERISRLSLIEFRKAFSSVARQYSDCRFNVEVVEHSYDTRPRDTVRTAFAVMWLTPDAERH